MSSALPTEKVQFSKVYFDAEGNIRFLQFDVKLWTKSSDIKTLKRNSLVFPLGKNCERDKNQKTFSLYRLKRRLINIETAVGTRFVLPDSAYKTMDAPNVRKAHGKRRKAPIFKMLIARWRRKLDEGPKKCTINVETIRKPTCAKQKNWFPIPLL